MRLSTKNEWIVVGLLSLYVAFVPQIPMAREFMSTSIGRLSAMASVIFTWKYVSELVAVLLAIVYIRCMLAPVWEGLEMPPTAGVPMPPAVASIAPVSAATTTATAAPTTMPPPNTAVSTAPITIAGAGTAMSTTPAPPVQTVGGVQPATSTMSMPVSVPVTVPV